MIAARMRVALVQLATEAGNLEGNARAFAAGIEAAREREAAGLWRGYDAQTNRVTLPIVGMTVALGESEERAGAQRGDEHEQGDD
jgi:hypothetical protein